MTKRMLIDSTHAEETRVVVLDGNRLEDYDVETSTKQQLKGNIYLAKIVRVEPSLQAAFVEFGGGRHGFLAFGEIHPDYYQIPVADRKRLLEMQEAEAREEEEEEEREAKRRERGGGRHEAAAGQAEEASEELTDAAGDDSRDEIQVPDEPEHDVLEAHHDEPGAADAVTEAGYAMQADPEAMPAPSQVAQAAAISPDMVVAPHEARTEFPDPADEGMDLAPELAEHLSPDGEASSVTTPMVVVDQGAMADEGAAADEGLVPASADPDHNDTLADPESDSAADPESDTIADPEFAPEQHAGEHHDLHPDEDTVPATPAPEHIGGELDTDDRPDRRQTPRFMRNYKIQEVMRRRQILLVQVVKEERGTKGAALTTYISLAGRFSVLMPNSPRGGGISRKITSAADRRRLKEITAELELPRGMGLIVRTAGAARPKPEILRDCEYLLNQWDQIRDLTMKSMAPALIYEEASLIKRAIRDVYSRDVDEILVDGEEGWRAARDFMRMLMPAHAKKVQMWRDPQPLFAKAQVEAQLDSMLQPTVQLRSGGYLVINQTEALVAIDVNSGRSTRERGIEETALRTNMEAAEEAARQLRLRDLAGLIVIDFIDMESRRNNASVEKKLKDALKNDRARIQVGSISHFGLLEMSRQRLRPSLAETSFTPCPHCGGTGHMRSTESAALAVLRGIEDEGSRRRAAEIVVHVHGSIALYILNHKRVRLAEIEGRFGMHVTFHADDTMIPPVMRIEKVRALLPSEVPVPIAQLAPPEVVDDPDDAVMEADDIDSDAPEVSAVEAEQADEDAPRPGETAEEGEQRQRKRRRRRRGGRREDGAPSDAAPMAADADEGAPAEGIEGTDESTVETGEPLADAVPGEGVPVASEDGALPDGERKRRGRRGGRRRRREPGAEGAPGSEGEDAGLETDTEATGAGTMPEAVEPAYAPQPYVPQYSGPTPANPFGGDSNAFAFFDAVEEVDHLPPARPAPVAAPISPPEPPPVAVEAVAEIEAAAAEAVVPHPEPAAEPAPELAVASAPEPAAAATPAPEPAAASASEPVAENAAASAPEPVPEAAAAPLVGPAVVPIMLGAPDAPAVEKRKGWWRR